LGDMTTINQNPIADERPIDLLVGGTPCQSFSVAGLRKGLADPRGNLMLTFLSIADKFRPKWLVWENVPGVLSSNGGRDFGTFLGALGELGYGFAYRVLDAQHFGVAQRRRRVFVVGYLGDWRVAAAVLFESESLQGNIKPSRKKREEAATYAQASVGESGDVNCVGGNLSPTVTSKWKTGYGGPSGSNETGNMVYAPTVIDRAAFSQGPNAQYEPRIESGETMSCLVAKGPHAVAQPIAFEPGKMQRLGYGYSDNGTSPTLRSEPGDNQLAVAQPIAFKVRGGCEGGGKGYLGQEEQAFTISTMQDQQIAQPLYYESHPQDSRVNGPKDVADTVSAKYGTGGGNTPLVQQPIAVDWRTAQVDQGITQTLKTDLAKMSGPCIAVDVYNQSIDGQTSATITEAVGGTNTSRPKVMQPMAFDWQCGGDMRGMNLQEKTQLQRCQTPAVMHSMAIRRLTPKECERLQGFPDDWTKVPYRNKEADQCPDGPRYKACGNSMAVPVMRWIGERINLIESML
jgi:DNA (cytosine-5)-methyltransferase 1